jgi:hypothetical protein
LSHACSAVLTQGVHSNKQVRRILALEARTQGVRKRESVEEETNKLTTSPLRYFYYALALLQ